MGDIHLCNIVYFVQFANSVNSYNLRAVQLHVQLIFCKNKNTKDSTYWKLWQPGSIPLGGTSKDLKRLAIKGCISDVG